MNILYLGDIMAQPGIDVVVKHLAGIRREFSIDLVIAQSENVTDGRGLDKADYDALRHAGVDGMTGGNWSLHRPGIVSLLNDPNAPVLRPANYPEGTPGLGCKYITTTHGEVLVVSLLGKIVGRDADKEVDNPLHVIDAILEREKSHNRYATVVNFHGDFSSEKVIIGNYLDGRVSMVVGDHWHVPTADARVLPGGTAHMTDVGMCGVLNSSLGVTFESVTTRWHDNVVTRNIIETTGPRQLSGLLATINDNGLATSVEHIYRIYD